MFKNKKRMTWGVGLALVLAVSFFTFYSPSKAIAGEHNEDNFEYYAKLFQSVYQTLRENYVDESKVTAKNLFYGAMKGMLESVEDPFTFLMDEKVTEDLDLEMSGEYGGLGMYIGMSDEDRLIVISPIEDTPAEAAGLQGGDIISEIEGKTTRGMKVDEAVRILRGKPGTSVTITVERDGIEEPMHFTVTRAKIKLKSVKYKMLDDNIGYVRLTTFARDTASSLREALLDLEKDGMKKVVVDLRNNPGGLLVTAIQTVDLFIEEGKIVYTRGRNPRQNDDVYASRRDDVCKGMPLIVLVNKSSASASEIFAGAIQDHKRGILVGEQTFGKFSVQNVFPLDRNGRVSYKLTVARYYTPNGRSLHEKGIEPDVVIEAEKFDKEDIAAVRKIHEEKYVKNYIKDYPDEADDETQILKLHRMIQANGIDVRLEVLRRLVHNERHRGDYKKIVDLEYDKQLRHALGLFETSELWEQ